MKTMVTALIITLCSSWTLFSQDFHPGPYGTAFFDIAGPFTVQDLNATVDGDVNLDEIVNIQDIIIIINAIMGNIELTGDQIESADVNSDGNLDILDVVGIVNLILYPQAAGWDFESHWNGEESYIFIHLSPTVGSSSALWNSNTKLQLLENSPSNVHYFFISNQNTAPGDVQTMANSFDSILAGMSPELQNHWHSHLHFIPQRSMNLDNWLAESLQGNYSLGIDRFQRIMQIGYLGNPNGFTGTHMSYLAHEAIHYNYVWNTFFETEQNYQEVVVFDSVLYNGGWGSTVTGMVDLPSATELEQFSRMEVEAWLPCSGYDDDNCDDYDRIAGFLVCEDDGTGCTEIARWITPFDRQPHWLTDISPFISALYPGDSRFFKFYISGWPNSLVTIKLRLYNEGETVVPRSQQFLWSGGQFNSNYNSLHDPVIFEVPAEAVRVEFVSYITGHGGGCDSGNCAEFCNSRHNFEVNGGMGEFSIAHPEAGTTTNCMQLERIAEGVIPNQWGTWGYGRAGWCPGLDVAPYVQDVTDMVIIGDENIITYDACWIPYGTQCTGNWPAPIDCGGGYQAEIIMSSYVVFWY